MVLAGRRRGQLLGSLAAATLLIYWANVEIYSTHFADTPRDHPQVEFVDASYRLRQRVRYEHTEPRHRTNSLRVSSGSIRLFPAENGVREEGGEVVLGDDVQEGEEAGAEDVAGDGEVIDAALGTEAESRVGAAAGLMSEEEREEALEREEVRRGSGLGWQESAPGEHQQRRRSIWMPCYNETEAERLGVHQWRQARPPGMKSKEFDAVAKCWRKRGKSDPLLPAEQLPPTSGLELRMDEGWLRSFLFLHAANVGRLGKGFADEEGTTLSDTEDVLQYLPQSGEEALSGMRHADCAVVGSGGSLYGAGQGGEIDQHEVVLRVNEAPVAGYQRDVGRRTDMRLINNLWSDKYSKGPVSSRPLEEGVALVSTRADGDSFLELGKWLRKKRPDVRLRLMSSRVVTAIRQGILVPWRQQLNESDVEALQAAVLEGRDTPSSGLISTFLLLQLCESVTVYGFTGINDGNRYHYYKTARRYQNRTHSFTAERALFRALDRDGVIKFVDGNPDSIHTWI